MGHGGTCPGYDLHSADGMSPSILLKAINPSQCYCPMGIRFRIVLTWVGSRLFHYFCTAPLTVFTSSSSPFSSFHCHFLQTHCYSIHGGRAEEITNSFRTLLF